MPTREELDRIPEQRDGTLGGPAGSDLEIARDLVANVRLATLSTLALRPRGFPYGSLVAVAADDLGRPLLLLSALSEHTKNLAACDKASVLFVEPGATDIVAAPRVTLVGTCVRVPDDELAAVRARYVAVHPQTADWFTDRLHDYRLYRLAPTELRLIVGFGRLAWLTFDAYSRVFAGT